MPEKLVNLKMHARNKHLFDQIQLDLERKKGVRVTQSEVIDLMLAEFLKRPVK